MFEVSDEVRRVAREELMKGPPAAALRRLAQRFDLQRTNLAWVAAEVFDNMFVPDLQAIWEWDLEGRGDGHSDAELDAMLAHLRMDLPRPRVLDTLPGDRQGAPDLMKPGASR
ncbi:hypothetical protein [Variovorax sp. YR216]|uniref:hypothetical protein n=1 Tax=Variovorax sp. YR216 TaxID=1882828 RepID=UPI000899B2B9|nr:hypothetical protein [Variovorax sp. YR216]SEB22896.1 hypothetical protein SAMN05444680_1177 [Variovorax sp. YR216]